MSKVFIYGFEPFRDYSSNCTQAIIDNLPLSVDYQALVLPVRFEKDIFLEPIKRYQPDYILGLGQYPWGGKIRIERRAFNWQRESRRELGEAIDPLLEQTRNVNWKISPNSRSRVTYDAGRYVCNFSSWTCLDWALREGRKSAFLHVPRDYPLQDGVAFIQYVLATME